MIHEKRMSRTTGQPCRQARCHRGGAIGRGEPQPRALLSLFVCSVLYGVPLVAWAIIQPSRVYGESQHWGTMPPSDYSAQTFSPHVHDHGPDDATLWSDAAPASAEHWRYPDLRNAGEDAWTWRVLPNGLIYPSYLAGTKESRFASVWNHDSRLGWMWDLEAGGRVGLVRFGTDGGTPRPNGWQLDLEGAAFPRLDLDHERDLISVDFRVGVPLTFGCGPVQVKLAAYHLSSHLGDEFSLRFPDYPRINYSRDALVLGGSYYLTDDLRLYAEAEWAWYTDGGTRPWEFQFGLDYSPVWSWQSRCGAPFLALNGQLREEVDFGGTFVVQTGWQWRGESNHLFRVGVQYFTGKSDQFQFFRRNEEKIGIAMWYDY